MGRPSDPEGAPRPGLAVAALRGLLEISRLTRRQVPIGEVLQRIASIVGHQLGFTIVAMSDYLPDAEAYEIVAVHGDADARGALLGQVRPATMLAPLLDPRFERHGAYFICEGAFECEPDIPWYRSEGPTPRSDDASAWRIDDALVVPLIGTGGRHLGMMGLDHPADGRRPDDQQLEVLSVFSAHAALAIESARQLGELQSALARHRAVLTSSLDCVIAMDGRGVVTEFNPAAERTFGYTAADAIGRSLAELLLPEAERDEVAREFVEGLGPGGALVGERRERTVMRADGSPVPIEYAVTPVPVTPGERATFYGFVRDISERRRAEAELSHLAYHDSLTGLPNRAQLEREVDLALARAGRAGTSVALMFVDLDDFKAVNDRHGHGVGDRFLAAVADRLQSVLRDQDVLARQGGDEFIVLLADLDHGPEDVARTVADKLLSVLREPIEIGGRALRTGASIGVSVYPEDSADATALLRDADAAMYAAKAAGGGRLQRHHIGASLGGPRPVHPGSGGCERDPLPC